MDEDLEMVIFASRREYESAIKTLMAGDEESKMVGMCIAAVLEDSYPLNKEGGD